MTEVSTEKNIYTYGANSVIDINKPIKDRKGSINVYAQPLAEHEKAIGSLEGFFITEIPLIKKGDKGVMKDWQLNIYRSQMKEFEEMYQGKFIPFEK
jgi:hypothetical protein